MKKNYTENKIISIDRIEKKLMKLKKKKKLYTVTVFSTYYIQDI